MATTMKRTTKAATTSVKEEVTNTNVESIEEIQEVEVKKVEKRKFQPDDEIPCVSLFPGQYFVEGERSKDLYTFAEIDDVQYIRYDDLDYMVKRHLAPVYKPRFVIQDQDFLNLHPEIEDLYSSLYSSADLLDILKLQPNQLKARINSLPLGAKDALKVLVMNEIESGRFDSNNRIKVIDEAFGTQMAARFQS